MSTIAELVETYLTLGTRRLHPRTLERYICILKQLVDEFGSQPADGVKPIDLLRWYARQEGWRSGWTVKGANQVIQRLFNWSVRQGLLLVNPVRFIELDLGELPMSEPVTEKEFRAILRASDAFWRRFMMLCWWTGCRPGELAAARWKHVDWKNGRIVLPDHKTAKKTRRPRVVYCPPPAMRLLRWLDRNRFDRLCVALHAILTPGPARVCDVMRELLPLRPSVKTMKRAHRVLGIAVKCISERVPGTRHAFDPTWVYYLTRQTEAQPDDESAIFIGHRGEAITRNAWQIRMWRLKERTGLRCRLYGTRHAFAHRCIKRNVNLKVASLLLGHTSTQMIERHYLSALGNDVELLQSAVVQANITSLGR